MYDGDTFEHKERTFKVQFPRDNDMGPPWEASDGHGPVSEWTHRAKRPGELILISDRGSHRYYDFEAASRMAREWVGKFKGRGKAGKAASEAARADYDRLRRWCNDQWEWCGVVVTLLDTRGKLTSWDASLWGIESDCTDYLAETARELAGQILHAAWSQNPCAL